MCWINVSVVCMCSLLYLCHLVFVGFLYRLYVCLSIHYYISYYRIEYIYYINIIMLNLSINLIIIIINWQNICLFPELLKNQKVANLNNKMEFLWIHDLLY